MKTFVTFVPETDEDLLHPLAGAWVLAQIPGGEEAEEQLPEPDPQP